MFDSPSLTCSYTYIGEIHRCFSNRGMLLYLMIQFQGVLAVSRYCPF